MTRLIISLLITPLTFAVPIAHADDNARDMKLEELPKPARDTVQRETKGGKITEIDRDDEQGRMFYEVEFIQGNQRYEIHVAQDGKLLARKAD
jgi:uncharacterized membrane protein YkoI